MIVAIEVLKHALIITLFVFVMMVLIDYINVVTRGQLSLIVGAFNAGKLEIDKSTFIDLSLFIIS